MQRTNKRFKITPEAPLVPDIAQLTTPQTQNSDSDGEAKISMCHNVASQTSDEDLVPNIDVNFGGEDSNQESDMQSAEGRKSHNTPRPASAPPALGIYNINSQDVNNSDQSEPSENGSDDESSSSYASTQIVTPYPENSMEAIGDLYDAESDW